MECKPDCKIEKVYIAGKITGNPDFKRQFAEAEKELRENGYAVMNPAVLGQGGFSHEEYMRISYAMIDVCDAVYFLSNWQNSRGAEMEYTYALQTRKEIMFQVEEVNLWQENRRLVAALEKAAEMEMMRYCPYDYCRLVVEPDFCDGDGSDCTLEDGVQCWIKYWMGEGEIDESI